MVKKEVSQLPEVRQCVDKDSHLFGAVAVKSDIPGIAWGVMTRRNGGHLCENDSEVESWPKLASPPTPSP